MRPHRGAPAAGRRHPRTTAVPAVLPQVIVTIDEAGHAQITAGGITHLTSAPPGTGDPEEPIDRHHLGAALARIAEQAGGPVRVEVREADGSRYADILQPHPDDPPQSHDREWAAGAVLEGEGFLPGETVLVAVVTTTARAGSDGTVRLPAPPPAPDHVDELVLFGTNSGTILCDPACARTLGRRRP